MIQTRTALSILKNRTKRLTPLKQLLSSHNRMSIYDDDYYKEYCNQLVERREKIEKVAKHDNGAAAGNEEGERHLQKL